MANLKAVLQRPKVSASYSRNAFDRGFSPKLHYQLGGLTPFFAEQVIAGSHCKLNRSIFQRTAAVNTAAFPKVDTHCEFFFVPLRLLWSYWNNFKLNIQDYNSSYQYLVANNGTATPHNPGVCPKFDVAQVHNDILGWLTNVLDPNTPGYYFTTKSQAVGAMRLLDSLGYGLTQGSYDPNFTSNGKTFEVNAFKLLAYQKIYFDHFRNTAYESNDASAYNADGTFTPNNNFPLPYIGKFLTYRYVNYRKDYFQSVYPSLNYTQSSPNGSAWILSPSIVGAEGNFMQTNISTVVDAGVDNIINSPSLRHNTVELSTGQIMSCTSVQQIRAAFALDKLLRASAYAPKHVRDQFEARYGVKNVESGNESVRIGAFMNDIVFQEVTSMANTASSGSNLGEIGAKGVGYSGYGDDIEFTAKEDGIIMGLIYSMPRSSYDSTRIQRWNTKESREDFFIPEYMDLGLQPVLGHEQEFNINFPANYNLLCGYQDRYQEYKCGYDVNHGLFNSGRFLDDFVVHTNQSYSVNAGLSAFFFKVKPTDMDSIFAQTTDVTDWTTDKFITYLDIKFIVNQNISVHGQPRLGGLG